MAANNISAEYADAIEHATDLRRVMDFIGTLSPKHARRLVFEALALLEGGGAKPNGTASVAPPAAPKNVSPKSAAADDAGPYEKIVEQLRAHPGMPIGDLTMAIYGVNDKTTNKRLRAALFALQKKERIRPMGGAKAGRGKWEATKR